MDTLSLVINPGSSSIKFGLFQPSQPEPELICRGAVEAIGVNPVFWVKREGPHAGKKSTSKLISQPKKSSVGARFPPIPPQNH